VGKTFSSPHGSSVPGHRRPDDLSVAEALKRRTDRAAVAPWLWHFGLVEFCRFSYAGRGTEVRRLFDLLRIRDASFALAAQFGKVPPQSLGVLGLVTDAFVLERLSRRVDAETLLLDRALTALPISYAWAISFDRDRPGPFAVALPGLAVWAFAWRRRITGPVSRVVVLREAVYGAAFIGLISELSSSVRKAIKQELEASAGSRRSIEVAAELRAKKRSWLVDIHSRLHPMATARWAAAQVPDPEGHIEGFVHAALAEERSLRQIFEHRPADLRSIIGRIVSVRSARSLETIAPTARLDVVKIDRRAEALVEWLVEGFCPFASQDLRITAAVRAGRVDLILDAAWFPPEVMPPFELRRNARRYQVRGSLPVTEGALP
jgi:hypothetical protein